jgi:predicted extracellular nuclease
MNVRTTMLRSIAVVIAIVASALAMSAPAAASIAITEWMYNPVGGPAEYFELTNVGTTPIDMTGWSQDDSTRTVGTHPLDVFGVVLPGESVIGCQSDADGFRTYWDLPTSVKVIAYGDEHNLGRSDEINLYDNLGTLVDRLTYNDQGVDPNKGPRTQGVSGNIPLTALFQNTASAAVLSVVGDTYLSYRGGGGSGDTGNPGIYTPYVSVPEPASLALLLVAAGMASARRRRG